MTTKAVGYMRTSSDANAGDGKDSGVRQQAAIQAYADAHGIEVVGWYHDEGVSGATSIQDRPEFSAMMERLLGNGCRVILIESVSRFARDIEVQLAGHRLLKRMGIELVPVDNPKLFSDDDPQGQVKFFRTMLTAMAEMERAGIAYRLRVARDRASAKAGRRVEGRPGHPEAIVQLARRLYRKNARTGRRRSLAEISKELERLGHLNERGKPFHSQSVLNMLRR
jgi:DNA invertase Pin-like site-specific DNA recombinase